MIYQAQFFGGRWQGRADFLRRVAEPSLLGEHAYESLDTKRARQVKPHVIQQLSFVISGRLPSIAVVRWPVL